MFGEEKLRKDLSAFYSTINNLNFEEAGNLYKKSKNESDLFTNLYKDYKKELMINQLGRILEADSLEFFIKHVLNDYDVYSMLTINLTTSNGKLNFDLFANNIKRGFEKNENQSELDKFSRGSEGVVHIYFNTKLNKLIEVDYLMYLKSLINYFDSARHFYGEELVNDILKEYKNYLVKNNFK